MFRISTLIFLATWAFLSWFTPSTLFWRDSGEFIISATSLDIAHPAGFPLYSQLAHLFTHIPFGPLAWRVNLFSTFLAALTIATLFLLSYRVLTLDLRIERGIALICSILGIVTLLFSEAFIKQAFIAEVYLLNALIILILLLLTHLWHHTNDPRYLLCSSFLAALGLGNHVSIALIYILILVPLLIKKRELLTYVFPLILFFACGLSIYTYIPIRASNSDIILNTAKADSPKRFYNLLTNQRDWIVRGGNADTKLEGAKVNFHLLSPEKWVNLLKDLPKLSQQTSPLYMVLAIIGAFVLFFYKQNFVALLFIMVAVGNWIFFAGWYTDPWIPLIAMVALLSSVTIGTFISLISKKCIKITPAIFVIIVTALVFIDIKFDNLYSLKVWKNYNSTRERSKEELRIKTLNSYLIIEPSIFFYQYLTKIEGYRDDLNLVYLPDLLYPEFFNYKTYYDSNSNSFTPALSHTTHEPDINNLYNFLHFISHKGTIEIEPVPFLNSHLSNVLILTEDGRITLVPGHNKLVSDDFFVTKEQELLKLIAHYHGTDSVFAPEIASNIEFRAIMLGDLYHKLDQTHRSIEILELLCLPVNKALCFKPIANNIKAYRNLLNNKGNKINIGY